MYKPRIRVVYSDERLITPSGLGIIGGMLGRSDFVKRRKIRKVIDNLVMFACHVTEHARETLMGLGRSNTWRYAFMQLWLRFAAA